MLSDIPGEVVYELKDLVVDGEGAAGRISKAGQIVA